MIAPAAIGDPPPFVSLPRHLLAIQGLSRPALEYLLDLGEHYVGLSRQSVKKTDVLRGRTQVNLFFEPSTRTQGSFELAGKRLGADVMNMSVRTSSIAKGETVIDTAVNLNAMKPDLLVVRHAASGAINLLSQKVGCAVINAGDGAHEHPTQALLDALTIRRAFGRVDGLRIAICGDIAHSRVARSNLAALSLLGAEVRFIAPRTLLPPEAERLTPHIFTDMKAGLQGCDVVMALRLQLERMGGGQIPSVREYFRFYGLDAEKLKWAAPGARVMHPGPMNRGVEIASGVADDPERSLISDQVEMGVAVRMAVLHAFAPAFEPGAETEAEVGAETEEAGP
ncbi:MAG: aspartate carbamoyltransferase catalytic subunit [Pseudomonadota bacterium]